MMSKAATNILITGQDTVLARRNRDLRQAGLLSVVLLGATLTIGMAGAAIMV